MAQVELFFQKRQSFVGDIGAVHYERLSVLIRVGRVRYLECIVDTGAYLTVFPQDEWNRFREQIHWCSVADESRLPPWCKQFISAATRGPCPCRLGRVAIEVVDFRRPQRVIGPTDVFALFAADLG